MATIKSKQLDTGTTANKVVALDANAKLPAVAGDALTALPALNTHSDINAGSPSDGQVLTWVQGSTEWQAATPSASSVSRPTVTTDASGTDSTVSNPAASVLEDIYLVNNGGAAVNITLPTVSSNSGYKIQIKRLGTANVTVTPASGTIDGAANQVLSSQYSAFTCTTDGTNWFII